MQCRDDAMRKRAPCPMRPHGDRRTRCDMPLSQTHRHTCIERGMYAITRRKNDITNRRSGIHHQHNTRAVEGRRVSLYQAAVRRLLERPSGIYAGLHLVPVHIEVSEAVEVQSTDWGALEYHPELLLRSHVLRYHVRHCVLCIRHRILPDFQQNCKYCCSFPCSIVL